MKKSIVKTSSKLDKLRKKKMKGMVVTKETGVTLIEESFLPEDEVEVKAVEEVKKVSRSKRIKRIRRGQVVLEDIYTFVLVHDLNLPIAHWYLCLGKDTKDEVYGQVRKVYDLQFGIDRSKDIIRQFKIHISKGKEIYIGSGLGFRMSGSTQVVKKRVVRSEFKYPNEVYIDYGEEDR